jgi:hypothetical protein
MRNILYVIFIIFSVKELSAQANQQLSNLTGTPDPIVAINQSLVADSDNDTDLGSTTFEWRNLFLGNTLYFTEPLANVSNPQKLLFINEIPFMHNTGGGVSTEGWQDQGTFLGLNAGAVASTANNGCVGIGYSVLKTMSIGNHNTAVGWRALYNMNGIGAGEGDKNTIIGSRAGESIGSGYENIGIGWNVFYKGSSGASINNVFGNIAIGTATSSGNGVLGKLTTGGNSNTVVGSQAGTEINSGYGNTVLGYLNGSKITSGYNNILVGYNSGNDASAGLTTGSENILIGNGVNTTMSAATYQLNIGNTIYGDMSSDHISIGHDETPSMFSVGDDNQFRVDQNGRIERNNNQETVSNGVPSILAVVDLDNQTATLNGTLLSAAPAGTYRISYMGLITTAATTSSSLSIRVRYDDPNIASDVLVPSANVENVNSTSANAIPAGVFSSSVIIKVADGTDIRYRAIYSSDPASGAGSMVYSVRITLERL